MKCEGPNVSSEELVRLREEFSFTPQLDELAAGLALYGNPTRLKIYALLREAQEMCVCDLASVLDMTVSAVSQHLAKLRAVRLVKYRREAQTLYYALADHPLNEIMKAALVAVRADEAE